MIKTFDGKSFKRSPNPSGEKAPVTGVQKERALYTATGGEETLNLSALSPAISYHPGKNTISVKRETVPVMMTGIHFIEEGPTLISFSTPLQVGEKVEITKELSVTSVMAVATRPEVFSAVAGAGQSIIDADFFWHLNQNPIKTRGAVRVEVDGIAKERYAHYIELPIGVNSMTNKIQFINPLVGGEKVTLLPTNQAIDNTPSLTSEIVLDVLDLKTRMTTIENEEIPDLPVRFANGFSPAHYADPNDPSYVDPPPITTSSTVLILIPGAAFLWTSIGGLLDIDTFQKFRYSDINAQTDIQLFIRVYNHDTNVLWSSREITSAGLNSNGSHTHLHGSSLTRLPAGNYRIETWMKCWSPNPIEISPWFRMSIKELV